MQHAAQQCAEHSGIAEYLPHNIEAEQGLLGAVLINNEAYTLVARLVEVEHFFDPIHGRIYATAGSLIQAGRLATPFTLKDYLPADLDIAGMSLDRFLARLCAEATTVINAPDYAKTICDLAHRRTMMAIAEELRAIAASSPVDFSPDMLARQTIERLHEIVTARTETHVPARLRPLDLKQFLQLSVKRREMILELPEKGLAMLYAGRGTGKTLVALGIAFAVASGRTFLKWTAPKAVASPVVPSYLPTNPLLRQLEPIHVGGRPRLAHVASTRLRGLRRGLRRRSLSAPAKASFCASAASDLRSPSLKNLNQGTA
jgi:DnaB-like helicase N terminal domain/AAA domain